MHPRRWTHDDFDAMSWHDCHVHAMRVTEGPHGAGELALDLDCILEWRCEDQPVTFLLVPATLCFHDVVGLRVVLDWATPTAGLGPFALSGIERSTQVRPRYTATLWRLAVSWPVGEISFEGKGYTQMAWGREVVSDRQVLSAGERVGGIGVGQDG
jgi:hypothetical protein